MAETCKIGEEHEIFAVLTTPRSLAMKYIDVKRTFAKRLRGGDALKTFFSAVMVDDHDDGVRGILDIIGVMHESTRILRYKMYYSLCWTQRCRIQYYKVSVQEAARAYKNSVFFECVFDRRLDECCRLFVLLCIDSATRNNDHILFLLW